MEVQMVVLFSFSAFKKIIIIFILTNHLQLLVYISSTKFASINQNFNVIFDQLNSKTIGKHKKNVFYESFDCSTGIVPSPFKPSSSSRHKISYNFLKIPSCIKSERRSSKLFFAEERIYV